MLESAFLEYTDMSYMLLTSKIVITEYIQLLHDLSLSLCSKIESKLYYIKLSWHQRLKIEEIMERFYQVGREESECPASSSNTFTKQLGEQ